MEQQTPRQPLIWGEEIRIRLERHMEEERALERLEEEERRQTKLLLEEEIEKIRQEKEQGTQPSNLTDQQERVREYLRGRHYYTRSSSRAARGRDPKDVPICFRLVPLTAEERLRRRRIKARAFQRNLRARQASSSSSTSHPQNPTQHGAKVHKPALGRRARKSATVVESSSDDDDDSKEQGEAQKAASVAESCSDDGKEQREAQLCAPERALAEQLPGSAQTLAKSPQLEPLGTPVGAKDSGSNQRLSRLAAMDIGFILNQ